MFAKLGTRDAVWWHLDTIQPVKEDDMRTPCLVFVANLTLIIYLESFFF